MHLLFVRLSSFTCCTRLLFNLLFFVHFCNTKAITKLPPNETSVPAVIVFGDSIVDTGNNNYLPTIAKCNFSPYGKDFPGGVPTGRFSDGKVPSDMLAEKLGVKELLPPYLSPNLQPHDLKTGVCFASGGAGFDPLTSQLASCLSLSDQLEMFMGYIAKLKGIVGEDGTNFILARSVFALVAGSNDIDNTYFGPTLRRSQYDVPSYTGLMVDYASTFLQTLYQLGARRIAVLSVPPIGCLPTTRTLTGGVQRQCSEKHNQAAKIFNSMLSRKLDALNRNLPDSRMVYVDIYNPLLDLIQNPTKYGFVYFDKGCCGTGKIEATILCNPTTPTCTNVSQYLFWDSFHPTEAAYNILTQIFTKYKGIL